MDYFYQDCCSCRPMHLGVILCLLIVLQCAVLESFHFCCDRPDLMVKKLRYYARFIVVCLLLKKMKLVRDLVRVSCHGNKVHLFEESSFARSAMLLLPCTWFRITKTRNYSQFFNSCNDLWHEHCDKLWENCGVEKNTFVNCCETCKFNVTNW